MKKSNYLYLVLFLLILIIGGKFVYQKASVNKSINLNENISTTNNNKKQNEDIIQKQNNNETNKQSTLRKPINWQESSENKSYPNLDQVKDFWIKVKLKENRTYLMSDNEVIYTMYSSGGKYYYDKDLKKKISYTPTGTFYIETERGDSFFNDSLNEGANNWVSWRDHGVYLFHSVPTNADGSYNLNEAKKLGKEPASHGCIRLSVPDSKWISQNLKVGTKVVIEN